MGNKTSSKKIHSGDHQTDKCSNIITVNSALAADENLTVGQQSDATGNDGGTPVSQKQHKHGKVKTRIQKGSVSPRPGGPTHEIQGSPTNKKENSLPNNHCWENHEDRTSHSPYSVDDSGKNVDKENCETIKLGPTEDDRQRLLDTFTCLPEKTTMYVPIDEQHTIEHDIDSKPKGKRKKKKMTQILQPSAKHELKRKVDKMNAVVAALGDLCRCNDDISKDDPMQIRGYEDIQGLEEFWGNISLIEKYVMKKQSDTSTVKHADYYRHRTPLEKHISALDRLCQFGGHGPRIDATDLSGNSETEKVMKQVLYIEDHIRTRNQELLDAKREVQEYLNRLSQQAGDMLCNNNPGITNLSDEKRPMKLAEEYKSLYDNEWTDVIEEMEKSRKKGQRRRTCVLHLYAVLKSVYLCCKQKAEQQIEGVAKHLFLLDKDSHSREQILGSWNDSPEQKLITDYRKSSAEARIIFLQKTIREDKCFLQHISSCEDLDNGILVQILNSTYFDKCIELCWRFVIQTPPVFLNTKSENGNPLDRELYSEYTRAGKVVDYVVWPVLYLTEGGPVLAKGVAQPQRCSESK